MPFEEDAVVDFIKRLEKEDPAQLKAIAIMQTHELVKYAQKLGYTFDIGVFKVKLMRMVNERRIPIPDWLEERAERPWPD